MLKNFHATRVDARPEDIQEPVGVSERFKNLVEEKIAERHEAGQEPAADGAPKEDIGAVLERTAGMVGEYKVIPCSMLSPTPDAWNQFTPISEAKKVLMADSIHRTGLQQPIVVREMDAAPSGYQILAGNTRTSIYRLLYEITQDKKYLSIPAIVYKYGILSDDKAREIVTDTNYVQRDLSRKDRAFAVHEKMTLLRRQKVRFPLDRVAEAMKIGRTSVYKWDKIFNLIPELFELYDNDAIDMKAAARLGTFPKDIQKELAKEKDSLSNEVVMQIPAKTILKNVVEAFHRAVERVERKKEAKDASIIQKHWHVKKSGEGYRIIADGAQEEGVQPIVLLLPPDKITRFQNIYESYILPLEE